MLCLTGVVRTGETKSDREGKPAPHCPEVGDQIRTLDQECRTLTFAANDAQLSATALLVDLAGVGVELDWIAPVVRALVLDDETSVSGIPTDIAELLKWTDEVRAPGGAGKDLPAWVHNLLGTLANRLRVVYEAHSNQSETDK